MCTYVNRTEIPNPLARSSMGLFVNIIFKRPQKVPRTYCAITQFCLRFCFMFSLVEFDRGAPTKDIFIRRC